MRYHEIKTDNMENGDGLRVVIWLSGCSHHCKGCQNPETWDPHNGKLFTNKEREYIFKELKKDYISGITLTGGDPFYPDNIDDIRTLTRDIKSTFPDKTIWAYTGYSFIELMIAHTCLEYIDVVVDGEFVEENRDISLMWRGSPNQFVIDVYESLKNFGIGTGKCISHIPLEPQVKELYPYIESIVEYDQVV